MACYEVGERRQLLVVFHPIINQTQVLKVWRGNWSHDIQVLPVSALHSLIGVFNGRQGRIYIQRRHPGLIHLTQEQQDITNDNENAMED